MAGAAHHLLVGGQRVGDRLLHRLHHGGVEGIEKAPREEGELVVPPFRAGAEGDGTGLRGLAQRAAAVDGTLTIDSPPGGPTVIAAELPCES